MAAELFISYARKDLERVQPWVQRLQAAGLAVWMDVGGLDGALLWGQEIVAAIKGCRVLILMVSATSVASEQVVREVSLAVEARKPIFPLLLEPVEIPPSLRYPLAGIQQLELFADDQEAKFAAILRSLQRLSILAAEPGTQAASPAATGSPPHDGAPGAICHEPSLPVCSSVPTERARHNLPLQLTSFVGREPEIAAAKQGLQTSRLLTLTGAGGGGKTRLALQVAADLVADYAEGVWLVELAALADPALVPQTVASALGVREEPGRPLTQTLTDYLKPRSLLLLLDNCEHLLAAVAPLAESLLRTCPHLRILATSRERLGVAGETISPVPALSLPDPKRLPPVATLIQFEAVHLFVDRATAALPSFALSEQNAAAVVQVCQRLDGIPLAVELAAARVRALPVEQIEARLDDRFRLLTRGTRTGLPHQQTLRALIDWSYHLLSEAEQALLRRLSVFAGGWTLEAAEAVCAGEGIEEWEVVDLLTSLVDKSLVVYEGQGSEARYRLLETIRQYGAEKLQGAEEESTFRERHRDWCLALTECGGAEGERLRRLEAEHENLRTALAWSTQRGEGEAGLRLGARLWLFWVMRGYLAEGWERLTGLLAIPGARPEVRASGLVAASVLALHRGDSEAARAWLEESLAIHRELGDQGGVADSLHGLGWAAWMREDYGAARVHHEESLAIKRELGNEVGVAYSLLHLGLVAHAQGDHEAARAFHEESLAINRKLGDERGVAMSLGAVAGMAWERGDYEAAQALYQDSLPICREFGATGAVANTLKCLGAIARYQGDSAAAQAYYEESLAIHREMEEKGLIPVSSTILCNLGFAVLHEGDAERARDLFCESLRLERERENSAGQIGLCLVGLAGVAHLAGQFERAARLLGAASFQFETGNVDLAPVDRAEYDRSVAALQTALGEEAFTAAWGAGRALSLEQAIAEALEAAGA